MMASEGIDSCEELGRMKSHEGVEGIQGRECGEATCEKESIVTGEDKKPVSLRTGRVESCSLR